MALERKKTLNVFKDARDAWGSYDDFPVGQPGMDPMPHLSRNRVAQPFYLVSEADQVVIQMAGRGEIRFRDVEPTVREAVAWYCACGALVASTEIAPGVVQDAYLAAVVAFNASARVCPACAQVHPRAELGDIAWAETAAAIRASI